MADAITDGHDESKLPKWAQDRLRNLRRKIDRLTVETINQEDVPEGVRVMISRGTYNERYQYQRTAIPLEENDSVRFYVTGGYMDVQLSKFGSRYRVRIVGQGEYDRLAGDRPDIAILPAMGNVVEVAFVMQAPDRMVMPEVLAIEPTRLAVNGSADLNRVKFDPPLTDAEADAFWVAISDESESGDPS